MTILQSRCHYGDASDTRGPPFRRKTEKRFFPRLKFSSGCYDRWCVCVCSNSRGWGENQRSANPLSPLPLSVFFPCTLHLCNLIFFPSFFLGFFFEGTFIPGENNYFFWQMPWRGDIIAIDLKWKNRTGRKQIPFWWVIDAFHLKQSKYKYFIGREVSGSWNK